MSAAHTRLYALLSCKQTERSEEEQQREMTERRRVDNGRINEMDEKRERQRKHERTRVQFIQAQERGAIHRIYVASHFSTSMGIYGQNK